ncbi:DUF6988 family protein [Undibacterium luofuense]|uniref:Uncharacterized protein n=1 Tax=Undibacterium luofuense TaxID=2828733 RepID=A0A941I5Q9_9BURK|nr:hypothetical protein [Undibacterium luofuense]MBR7780790.1 hypothetical protein [Undibacterium luofuense]
MNKFDTIESATELVEWLIHEFRDFSFPATLRNKISASCFAVAQEHQHAIVLCLSQQAALNASAFSLVRVQYEAYIRGMWISHCAREDEIDAFSKGNLKLANMDVLVAAIDHSSEVKGQLLSTLHKNVWKSMCAYTHTGPQQIQRWITEESIEPNYSAAEVKEVLAFSSKISLLSAVSVASLTNNHILANKILEKYDS